MNFILKLSALILIITYNNLSYASSYRDTIKAIDDKYTSCLKNPQTNSEMINCADQAYNDWDKILNDFYKQIMSSKIIRNKDKINIKRSQKSWLKFRDAEFEALNSYYGEAMGSIWISIRIAHLSSIVKQRVNDLAVYLSLCDDIEWRKH